MPVSKRARRRAQRFVVAARSKVKGEEVELEEVEESPRKPAEPGPTLIIDAPEAPSEPPSESSEESWLSLDDEQGGFKPVPDDRGRWRSTRVRRKLHGFSCFFR